MADDSTPRRRRRWPVIVPLLGVLTWYVRSRRAHAAGPDDGWPASRSVPAAPSVAAASVAPPTVAAPSVPAVPSVVAASVAPTTVASVAPASPEEPAASPQERATPPEEPAAPSEELAAQPRPLLTPAATAIDPQPSGATSTPASPDGSPPGPEYTIKGKAASMLFHLPSSPYYQRTKAEIWFRTPEDAQAAGFTEWTPRKRASR